VNITLGEARKKAEEMRSQLKDPNGWKCHFTASQPLEGRSESDQVYIVSMENGPWSVTWNTVLDVYEIHSYELRVQTLNHSNFAHAILEARQISGHDLGTEEPVIEEVRADSHSFKVVARHPGFKKVMDLLVETWKDAGAENFLTLTGRHDELGELTITVQKADGITPAQKIEELKDENGRLAEALAVHRDHAKAMEKIDEER
jgi:hypothetical protein